MTPDESAAGYGRRAGETDRRAGARVNARLVVRYRAEGARAEFVRESADVSYSGMFVLTAEPPAAGTKVAFDILDPERGRIASGTALVRWVRAEKGLPGKPGGMGLQFLDLDEASHRWIARIVERQLTALSADIDPSPARVSVTADAGTVPWAMSEGATVAPPLVSLTPAPSQSPVQPARPLPRFVVPLLAALAGLVIGWIARGLLHP
jgi:uncharacterized protein (TIGR02266 family)